MTSITERARQVLRDYQNAQQQARSYKDDHLSPKGLAAKHEQLLAAVTRDAHVAWGVVERELIRGEQDAERYTYTSNPPASAIPARAEAWRRTQTLLAAGRTARDVVDLAQDREQLLMLRDELPTWQAAQAEKPRGLAGHLAWSEPDTSALVRRIDQRLGELGDFSAGQRAENSRTLGPARVAVDQVQAVLDGKTSAQDAVIAIHYAEKNAAA